MHKYFFVFVLIMAIFLFLSGCSKPDKIGPFVDTHKNFNGTEKISYYGIEATWYK